MEDDTNDEAKEVGIEESAIGPEPHQSQRQMQGDGESNTEGNAEQEEESVTPDGHGPADGRVVQLGDGHGKGKDQDYHPPTQAPARPQPRPIPPKEQVKHVRIVTPCEANTGPSGSRLKSQSGQAHHHGASIAVCDLAQLSSHPKYNPFTQADQTNTNGIHAREMGRYSEQEYPMPSANAGMSI